MLLEVFLGDAGNRGWTLNLYNAINGTSYTDPEAMGSKPDIEVTVRMININYGENRGILDSCRPLKEYSWLIAEIRKNIADNGIEKAVARAISEMPDDFEIKPFLEAHRAEVNGMLLTEYNEAEAMELFKEEGREEGRKEGRKEGRIEGREEGRKEGREISLLSSIKNLMSTMKISAEEAMNALLISEDDKAKYMSML